MQLLSSILLLSSIVFLIADIVLFIILVVKNWDVTIRSRIGAKVIGVLGVLLIGAEIVFISKAYNSHDGDVWEQAAILVASMLITAGLCVAFFKYSSIKNRTMELLETLICVMESGDPNLDGHSLHVHFLSMLLYNFLPARYQDRIGYENLRYASLFLDMGKLGIPREIITKTGKLSPAEMDLMRRHPEISIKILAPVASFSMISDWILYHHERVDGRGYYGLKGDQIPLASRIMAVADTYSALTMDRTYKASLTYEEAIIELRQAADSQLDKELVDCFCEIPKHRVEACFDKVVKITERYKDEHFR